MNKQHYQLHLLNEQAMQQLGEQLIKAITPVKASPNGIVLYLNGDLGAGKTTLTRYMLRALGYQGKVKSPTYTLVEEYPLATKQIYHFDLYRLADPEELEFMGIRDYFTEQSLCLLEWAEKGQGLLPPADLNINIAFASQGRTIQLVANSAQGEQIICQLGQDRAK